MFTINNLESCDIDLFTSIIRGIILEKLEANTKKFFLKHCFSHFPDYTRVQQSGMVGDYPKKIFFYL